MVYNSAWPENCPEAEASGGQAEFSLSGYTLKIPDESEQVLNLRLGPALKKHRFWSKSSPLPGPREVSGCRRQHPARRRLARPRLPFTCGFQGGPQLVGGHGARFVSVKLKEKVL